MAERAFVGVFRVCRSGHGPGDVGQWTSPSGLSIAEHYGATRKPRSASVDTSQPAMAGVSRRALSFAVLSRRRIAEMLEIERPSVDPIKALGYLLNLTAAAAHSTPLHSLKGTDQPAALSASK